MAVRCTAAWLGFLLLRPHTASLSALASSCGAQAYDGKPAWSTSDMLGATRSMTLHHTHRHSYP